MQFIDINKAQTRASKYIKKVGRKYESLLANKSPKKESKKCEKSAVRKLGLLKNKITISDDFDDELPDYIMGEYTTKYHVR